MSFDSVKIQELIDAQNEKIPFSGTVLVQEKGNTVFEGAYGYANRSAKIENSLNTRFGIASGCKVFTAVAICQMVEKGLLSFDSLLKDCLDVAFSSFDPGVTIGHLLMHSSGIPDYFDEDVMDDYEALWKDRPMYQIKSPRDFLPMFQDKPVMFKPGERFHYNNAGFIILGLVVEQMSKMSFPEYIDTNIFKPSGMSDTGYFALDRLPERVATGYIVKENGTWRSNIYSIPVVGGSDGGCFTTAADMLRFWNALLNYKLLKEETTQEMLRCRIHAYNDISYGYGVWMSLKDSSYKYFLQGADPGVSFMSVADPKEDIQFAVLSNTDHGLWDICNGLVSMIASV